MENPEPRSITRYKNFNPEPVKIHLLKRVAFRLASYLPRSWRFFVMGLPSCDAEATARNEMDITSGISLLSGGIACKLGAHLTLSGTYIPALTSGAGPFIETRFLQKQRCFPKIHTVTGTVASLVLDGQINYYRWLMEALPRMRFLKKKEISYDWLYVCQQYSFHRESLRLLDCMETQIINCERVPYLRARKLLVPRFVDEREEWIIPWLRDQFLPQVPTHGGKPSPRHIYVARTKAVGRRTANQEKLSDLLESFGFISIILEDHSWLEQLALFQGAEAIMAPHGAGLANLAFCSPSTLIVELIAENYPFTFYPEISRRLKLEHHLISCTPVNRSTVGSSDILVPLDKVQGILKTALGCLSPH
jgi:hypothetical protein